MLISNLPVESDLSRQFFLGKRLFRYFFSLSYCSPHSYLVAGSISMTCLIRKEGKKVDICEEEEEKNFSIFAPPSRSLDQCLNFFTTKEGRLSIHARTECVWRRRCCNSISGWSLVFFFLSQLLPVGSLQSAAYPPKLKDENTR